MAFDIDRFLNERFVVPTETVDVPQLAPWFSSDEKPIWKIRALTANELAQVQEAERSWKRESAILEALSSGAQSRIVDELRVALGKTDGTVPELARRVTALRFGTVEPECSEGLAVTFSENFASLFFDLTNRILALTLKGAEPEKKRVNSG